LHLELFEQPEEKWSFSNLLMVCGFHVEAGLIAADDYVQLDLSGKNL